MEEESHVLDGIDLPCDQKLPKEIPIDISKHKETSILNNLFRILEYYSLVTLKMLHCYDSRSSN
jgi:hypothetical protein